MRMSYGGHDGRSHVGARRPTTSCFVIAGMFEEFEPALQPSTSPRPGPLQVGCHLRQPDAKRISMSCVSAFVFQRGVNGPFLQTAGEIGIEHHPGMQQADGVDG